MPSDAHQPQRTCAFSTFTAGKFTCADPGRGRGGAEILQTVLHQPSLSPRFFVASSDSTCLPAFFPAFNKTPGSALRERMDTCPTKLKVQGEGNKQRSNCNTKKSPVPLRRLSMAPVTQPHLVPPAWPTASSLWLYIVRCFPPMP